MSTTVQNELLERYQQDPDAQLRAKRLSMGKKFVELYPELTVDARLQERLQEVRSILRRVLARRGLATSAEQEARIDGCTDPTVLERWIDEAVTAASATDALR